VTLTALIALLGFSESMPALAQLAVRGYPQVNLNASAQASGVRTRSQRAKYGQDMVYTTITFPEKVVGILIESHFKAMQQSQSTCVFSAFTRSALGDSDSEFEGFDEDDEDDEDYDESAFQFRDHAEGSDSKHSHGNLMQLSDLLNGAADDEIKELVDEEDDALKLNSEDPLASLDLTKRIPEVLLALGPQNLETLSASLPADLRGKLNQIIHTAASQ